MEARLASALVDDVVEARVGAQTGELARRVFPQATLLRLCLAGVELNWTVVGGSVLVGSSHLNPGSLVFTVSRAGYSLAAEVLESTQPVVLLGSDRIARFQDMTQPPSSGCEAAVCLPITFTARGAGSGAGVLNSRHCIAVLQLAFRQETDLGESEMQRALALAAELSKQHSARLSAHLERIAGAVGHAAPPADTAPAGGPAASGGSGGALEEPGPQPMAAAARPAAPDVHCITLRFRDSEVEGAYQQWRNEQMTRADVVALCVLLVYYVSNAAAGGWLPGAAWDSAACAAGWAGAVALFVGLGLVAWPRTHWWYVDHRDTLLEVTYFLLCSHCVLRMPRGTPPPAGADEAATRARQLGITQAELVWLALLGGAFQFRSARYMLLEVATLLANLATCVAVQLAAAQRGSTAPARVSTCWGLMPQLVAQVVAPGALLWWVERRFRRDFWHRIARYWD